ncbi:tetratricopeptide repeat protein [Deinococcus marmoris]|uniref:tetratricopeptide repeat protein n=1 Tax=Deinococcus marmoris TaxID=249408 RepID=UPI00138DEF20|nr:tetratricopeptide repeat protein [Deinococcus marmoris]
MTLPAADAPPVLMPDRRVRVFISSTLGEAQEERQAVMQAVSDLELTPIYFEAGARPHSAQTTYRDWLAQSDVFVGIYLKSYGWVGPGMTISGLEDEWQRSAHLPRLAYVKEIHKEIPPGERQPELSRLLAEVGEVAKYHQFRGAEDLAKQVKQDLMALLSERFLNVPLPPSALKVTPGAAPADYPVPVPDLGAIERPGVLAQLTSLLTPGRSLVLTGQPGSGKTTLLKQFAREQGAAYVSLEHKTPLQALLTAGAAVAALRGEHPEFVTTEDAATAALQAQLLRGPITLLVDQADASPAAVRALLGITLGNGQAVYAANAVARDLFGSLPALSVPPLSQEEVEAVLAQEGRTLPPGELIALTNASQGNPLYLRYYLATGSGDLPLDLSAFEDLLWSQMDPVLQELTGLVALSRRPLDAEDLAPLLSAGGHTVTPMSVVRSVEASRGLLKIEDQTIQVFHPHFAGSVAEQLEGNGTARSFHRLLADVALTHRQAAATAFHLREAGDPRLDKHLMEGGRAAFLMGDWNLAADLLQRAETRALEKADLVEAGLAANQLADVLSQMTDEKGAQAAIDRAVERFEESKSPQHALSSRIFRSVLWVKNGRAPEGITELEAARDHIMTLPEVDSQMLAACEVNLSYAYKYVGRLEEARAAAERAAEVFARSGHQEGEHTAVINAAATAAELGDLDRAFELTERLRETARQRPRLEAARQNILTKIYRKRDEPEQAEVHAREAVRLSQQLGSPELEVMNLNTLGNTLIDQERRNEAEAAYREALTIARRVGDIHQEGHALELLSRLPLDAGDPGGARELAEQAMEIQRRYGDNVRVATTGEKLGKAYGQLGRWSDAATVLEESARAFMPSLVDNSGNAWVQAALAWAETGNLTRALQAVAAACKTFLAESAPILPEIQSAEELKPLLLSLSTVDDERYFLGLAARCVVRSSVISGEDGPLDLLVTYLAEQTAEGSVQHNNVLAAVLAENALSGQHLQEVEQTLILGRQNFHSHDEEEARLYTVGVQAPSPFIVQLILVGSGTQLHGLGLAIAMLLAGNETLLSQMQQTYSITTAQDFTIMLTTRSAQEAIAPTSPAVSAAIYQRAFITSLTPGKPNNFLCMIDDTQPIWNTGGTDQRSGGYIQMGIDLTLLLANSWGINTDKNTDFSRDVVSAMLR